MSVISWNVRGLSARPKRSSIRKIIIKNNPSFVFLQETKMEILNNKLIRTCWKSDDLEWVSSPSVGNSGGLLSMWNKLAFQKKSIKTSRQWIAIRGIILSQEFECSLINIYNPCEVSLRAEVWQEIQEYQCANPLPCLLIGDFNEVLSPKERGSHLFSQTGINDFKKFVQEMQLIEIPSTSGGFTWFRGNSKSILDRLFVTPEWITTFPSLKVDLLHRGLSDHCPLLVHSHTQNWGPRPFRFINSWLTDPNCMKIIKKAWIDTASLPTTEKMKEVKKRLKDWNTCEFGNIDSNIKKLENEIQSLDHICNKRDLSNDELEKRKHAQTELWAWIKRRELYWAQNARISWLKNGDRNTKFFHAVASIKRRKNLIDCIKGDDGTIKDPQQIKQAATSFYKEIFREEFPNRPVFDDLQLSCLSNEQASSLILPFSMEEIDMAVSSCDPDKAPGPDGFNFKFIKSAWDIIKHDIYEIVQEFWASSRLPKGCNTTFITLIPKCDNPSSFKDYRPISMVGCIYKIIAKLMALRLQKVMSSLISPLQSSYIEGRQILDGALVASEVVESYKKRGVEAILLKLDFHKAYDSVAWSFLKWILGEMKFPPQWIAWVMTCVSTASASILVNGSPTQPFKTHRGLRQGDPLSPFLFVLIVEALDRLIKKATSMSLWNGLEISKGGFKLTHLQYADDTLIFCEANTEALKNIKKALILFHLASGLQVNYHKSSLIGINTSSAWLNEAAASLLCKTGSVPFTYLGLPIGGNPSRLQSWDPIIEKIAKRLASWKGKMLSIGGRITLIKSSLANLPIYYMSLFPIPKGVVAKIVSITRAFLWCGDSEKKCIPMVAWSTVQLPKALGGLGIGNIWHKNISLLFKWIWRFLQNPDSMWCKVVREKYGYRKNLSLLDLSVPRSGGPWKQICAAIFHNAEAKSIVINGVRKSIGSGASTLFWHDPWVSKIPLKVLFPRLFSIAINQNSTVACYGFWDGYQWVWSFEWRRNLRPQDKVEKQNLDSLLQPVCPSVEAQDKLIWAHSKSGLFSTKSLTLELDKLNPPPVRDAVKGIWRGLVPHRVEVFVWIALLGKINTRHKLSSCGIIPPQNDICPLCSSNSETNAHLLLHCNFSQQIWYWWLDLWRIRWVFPNSLKDAFDQWVSPSKKPFFKKVWCAIYFIILWSLWKERNLRIFGNAHSSVKDLKDL